MISRATLDQLTQDLLAHLAASPDLVGALSAETGLAPGDLRRLAARTPEDLAAALLDFICGDDSRLIGFAEASGWPAARVAYARAALEAGAVG